MVLGHRVSGGSVVGHLQRAWCNMADFVLPLLGAGAQKSGAQGSSSSGTPAWLIVAIVVPIAVLVTAVAALATLIIRKQQPRKRKEVAADTGPLKVQHQTCTAEKKWLLKLQKHTCLEGCGRISAL